MIVAEELLKPVSEEAPCGEDLSYDPGFQAMETKARGTPETQFSEAKPPDWKEVRSLGLELFVRSKDLRVAVILAVAELELSGLPGFREVLALVTGLLERYWDNFHPQLDPGENNDPLERMNIVASLATPIGSYGDHLRVLERLRSAPLCDSIQMGRFSLSHILHAETGGGGGGDSATPSLSQIEAAFRDSNQDELVQNYRNLNESFAFVEAIDEYLTRTVGASKAPDLTLLSDELKSMRERIAPYLPTGLVTGEALSAGSETSGSAVTAPVSIQGDLQSREDVVRLLNKILEYYVRVEPSSPVPLILKRAVRLARMDFVQIIKDMAPDAISEIYRISGEKEE
ncbi:MAG: type VI secretion system protein TssA [Verrucomicrobia bacterium]|jgi:type VI secretion system protein ImpA|nr:type VI secretion system protein TssA [Verrucomicrobiota bacterium]